MNTFRTHWNQLCNNHVFARLLFAFLFCTDTGTAQIVYNVTPVEDSVYEMENIYLNVKISNIFKHTSCNIVAPTQSEFDMKGRLYDSLFNRLSCGYDHHDVIGGRDGHIEAGDSLEYTVKLNAYCSTSPFNYFNSTALSPGKYFLISYIEYSSPQEFPPPGAGNRFPQIFDTTCIEVYPLEPGIRKELLLYRNYFQSTESRYFDSCDSIMQAHGGKNIAAFGDSLSQKMYILFYGLGEELSNTLNLPRKVSIALLEWLERTANNARRRDLINACMLKMVLADPNNPEIYFCIPEKELVLPPRVVEKHKGRIGMLLNDEKWKTSHECTYKTLRIIFDKYCGN